MRPEQLGALWAGPLSFARSLLRIVEGERWEVERTEFALDARGEGRALYRVRTSGRDVYFYVLSFAVEAEDKTDRVAGVKWDAMAALFVGEPTTERMAVMSRELPKQKVGRADADTLIWLRGNKSSRSFDRVVASLSDGRQPDTDALLSTGYLFRTTAFYGNGKFGTMPFAVLRRLEILNEPYHAQLLAAWLLREFIGDLVDHLAAARNPGAIRLDADNRRFMGIGNSAGMALVPFFTRHPMLLDCWVRTYETAIAELQRRDLDPRGLEWRHLLELLARGQLYFSSLPEAENSFFLPPQALTDALEKLSIEAKALADKATTNSLKVAVRDLMDFAASTLHPEAAELLHALLLEIFSDIAETLQPRLKVQEGERPAPSLLTVAELGALLEQRYGWIKDVVPAEAGARFYFWHRSNEAGEPRVSLYGDGDWRRLELQMDLPIQAAELRTAMEGFAPETTDVELAFARPDLFNAIRRIKSDLPYSEVRSNLVGKQLSPMPLMRFLLAYYGLERFAASNERSVRGTMLQGAPTAEDIRLRRPGTWPLPLAPSSSGHTASEGGSLSAPAPRAQRFDDVYDGKRVAELLKSRHYTLLPLPESGDVRISTVELGLLVELALRRFGLPPGVAQPAGEIATLAEILGGGMIDALHDEVVRFAGLPPTEKVREFRPGLLRRSSERGWAAHLHSASLLACAPLVTEAAASLAQATSGPIELELSAVRHSAQVAPALVVDLAARGISSRVEILHGNAVSTSWRSTEDGTVAQIRIRPSEQDSAPLRSEMQIVCLKRAKEKIAQADRQGFFIAAGTMRPIVTLADEVLRQPDG